MSKLREIYTNKAKVSRHASDGDFDDNLMDFEDFEQAIADYEKSKWKTGFPDLIEGKDYSKNVLAELEDCDELFVMCVFEQNVDGDKFFTWANCYGEIDGDGYYDDNYKVIRWTEIPTTPKP